MSFSLLFNSRHLFVVLLDDDVQVAVTSAALSGLAFAEATEIVVDVVEVQVPRQHVTVFILRLCFRFCETFIVSIPIRVNITKVTLEPNKVRASTDFGCLEKELLLVQVCRVVHIRLKGSSNVVSLLKCLILSELLLFVLLLFLLRSVRLRTGESGVSK